jgi:DNA-binding MarR family transcriptional regulator
MALDEDGLRAWRAFLEAHARIMRVLEAELRAERDLPLTWYDALVQLEEAGGTLRMHEFAERLLLSRSATTRFADRLEQAGLVERAACDTDRRGMELRLTGLGRETLREAAPGHLRGVQEHFASRLTVEERRMLARTLGRLAAPEGADASAR